MKHYILDSYTILELLYKEPQWQFISDLLLQASSKTIDLSMSLINYGEIYYELIKKLGESEAKIYHEYIEHQSPIQIKPVDLELVKLAGRYKTRGGISYADCFVIATAITYNGTIITGDKEFKNFEKELSIEWL